MNFSIQKAENGWVLTIYSPGNTLSSAPLGQYPLISVHKTEKELLGAIKALLK